MSKIMIYGKGDEKTLDKFISDWNASANTFKDIYIDCEGGLYSVFQVMLDIINSTPSKCQLIACGELHSAAFEMFYLAKCRKKIIPFTFGMYHLATDEIETDEKGKPKSGQAQAKLDNLKATKKFTLSFCQKIGMNASEIKRIKNGEDVYFQTDRLNYFLKFTEQKNTP